MYDLHANLAYSNVATAPSPALSGTSLVVSAGGGALFPAVPFNAVVWPAGTPPLPTNAEIVRVTAISTDTLTIARQAEVGGINRTIVIGDQIAAAVTVKAVTDAEWAAGFPANPPAKTILSSPRTFLGQTANAGSTLISGHNWTTSGGDASTDLNYTGDAAPPNGDRCIKLVSNGAGGAAVTTCARVSPALNVSVNKCVVLQLKIDPANAAHLTSLSVYLGSGASAFTNFINQQLVGYVGSGADFGEMAQPGEWFTVAVPIMSFTSSSGTIDLTAIQDVRIRIADDNTGNKCTVYVGGAWFASMDTRYPNGVVSICFDDLWTTQYTAAMPKMLQYGYRGSLFAISDQLDVVGHLTSAQMNALRLLGWEVHPHAYAVAVHNQTDGYAGMTAPAITADWVRLRQWSLDHGWADHPVYAWPQGKFDTTGELVGRHYWSAARTICQRCFESVPPADPYRIKSLACGNTINVTPAATVGTLEWLVDKCFANGGWLVLTFHKLVASPATSLEFSTTNFATFIDYLNTKGIPVATVNEVLQI